MTPQEAAITLNLIPGLGSIKIQRLLDFFGSPEIALHANTGLLSKIKGIGPVLAKNIVSWKTITNTAKELDLAEKSGTQITTIFDNHYPSRLRNIADPPVVLYSRGDFSSVHATKSLAIVGSRQASHYGRIVAKQFAYELAETGVTIVSGLAKGIDTEAHAATIDASGQTIAVIGSGLNRLYPQENSHLARKISQGHGVVISEFPMELGPGKTTFPMRNRIISALSDATLVIEAPSRSGSLITARQAAEQGRQVYAIPGPIDRPHSAGCHDLIRDGAVLVSSPEHIMEDMMWHERINSLPLFKKSPHSEKTVLSQQEELVCASISQGFSNLDSLCSACGMPAYELTSILAKLQIKHIVLPKEGGEFTLSK